MIAFKAYDEYYTLLL